MTMTFTHEELLLLRWLVFDAKDKLPKDQRSFLLVKLDKMLADDGLRFEIAKTPSFRH